MFEDNDYLVNGSSSFNTVIGAILGYQKLDDSYDEEHQKLMNIENLLMGYSYNRGAQSVGMYNYDMIRAYQSWNAQGLSALYDSINYEEVYTAIMPYGKIDSCSTKIIAKTILNKEENDFIKPNGEPYNVDEMLEMLKDAGYTEEDIISAMQLLIQGEKSNQTQYESLMDIPAELRYACAYAISENSGLETTIFYELKQKLTHITLV